MLNSLLSQHKQKQHPHIEKNAAARLRIRHAPAMQDGWGCAGIRCLVFYVVPV
jgi:hypothetical protein